MSETQYSPAQIIREGRAILGIELGSTRIKAVLIGPDHAPIASGGHNWENRLENGVWTYPLEAVWTGVQSAYAALCASVQAKYGVALTRLAAMGVSAMMHGYLAFDAEGRLLTPFRTWRNTTTEEAAARLTEALGFNMPQRWSAVHLYQAILNGEAHLAQVDYLTTLAGYVHWRLTGKKVLGIGDASGMFPVSSAMLDFDEDMLHTFDAMAAGKGFARRLKSLLPAVLPAGADAGALTADGARLLDTTESLLPGVPLCPPEGDAGTGMAATNSVAQRTGNVSAGTSIFVMVVLEKALSRLHTEIDMVTTPAGRPVAMAHGNNCTGDLDAWAGVFGQMLNALGLQVGKPALYDALYHAAMKGEPDCGGLLSYNYFSGEASTGFEAGRPLFVRLPNAAFNLPNFARNLLYSAMATLKIGMDILTREDGVKLDVLLGHGGLFKTPGVGQQLMAGALDVPVAVMESAGEGGAWGIALLAAYRQSRAQGESLEDYLANRVFASQEPLLAQPNPEDSRGFEAYMQRYKAGFAIQRAAVDNLK